VRAEVATDTGPTPAEIIVAPIDLKMRMAIELRRMSGNPIVLVDHLGRMAGLCGDDEIYNALLRARKTEAAVAE
jgi:glycine betaine/proline transport system ATP-binding protein